SGNTGIVGDESIGLVLMKRGGVNTIGNGLGGFADKMVEFLVVIVLAGALIGVVELQLASYAANETTFGPILQVIVPTLIGLAILLYGVKRFMHTGTGE